MPIIIAAFLLLFGTKLLVTAAVVYGGHLAAAVIIGGSLAAAHVISARQG